MPISPLIQQNVLSGAAVPIVPSTFSNDLHGAVAKKSEAEKILLQSMAKIIRLQSELQGKMASMKAIGLSSKDINSTKIEKLQLEIDTLNGEIMSNFKTVQVAHFLIRPLA